MFFLWQNGKENTFWLGTTYSVDASFCIGQSEIEHGANKESSVQ